MDPGMHDYMHDGGDTDRVGPTDDGDGGATPMPTPLASAFDPHDPLHLSDFALLTQALLNERMAPDILEYRNELVERVKGRLEDQDLLVEDLDQQQGKEMVRSLLALERDRLRWLLKSYLRARLAKVESYAAAILDSAELRERCSDAECAHANDYFVTLGRHLKSTVLDSLPLNFRSLVKQYDGEQGKSMIDVPDLQCFVFCRTLVDCGAVQNGDGGGTVDMSAGDLHVIPYGTVAQLVRADQVCLL